jgi:hypothetical protein
MRLGGVRSGAIEALRRLRWTRRIEHQHDAPLLEKLRWWRQGFRVESVRLYGLSPARAADYVPDFIVSYRPTRFNPAEAFFNHKAARRAMLLAAGVAQLETVALLWRGRAVLHPFSPGQRALTADELERWLIADGGEFVVKPEADSQGRRVTLIRSEGGKLARQYGTARGPYSLSECYRRLTMVERRAVQAAFWCDLFPDALNSIRVLTVWPEGDRLPFVARATQKIGTAASVPADNFARGGLAATVDIETGRMSPARVKHDLTRPIRRHPETGALIEGALLPDWHELRDDVVRIASGFPGDCFVGWDVFRDQNGRTVIIEANGGTTGVQILQMEAGLLSDPRIRRFYDQIGVL